MKDWNIYAICVEVAEVPQFKKSSDAGWNRIYHQGEAKNHYADPQRSVIQKNHILEGEPPMVLMLTMFLGAYQAALNPPSPFWKIEVVE